MRRCQNCIFFTESADYCSLQDRDVTRYNGCNKHRTWNEYQTNEDDEQETTKSL